MHVYLPEKYKPPFLHGVFLFSKVGVLIVNFDGFFILAYSSHFLKAGPLEGFSCHPTSMSSTLYLKGCQFCPIFSLKRKSWSQPYHVFLIALPAWSCPPSVQIGFTLGWGYVKVSLGFFVQWNVFMQNFWNFQVIPIRKIILTLVQNKLVLRNSSDSYDMFFWSDESVLKLLG